MFIKIYMDVCTKKKRAERVVEKKNGKAMYNIYIISSKKCSIQNIKLVERQCGLLGFHG